jgi:hypothetical protein
VHEGVHEAHDNHWLGIPVRMKRVLLVSALAFCQLSFAGATEVSVGNWSEPVRDDSGYELRGRLILCIEPSRLPGFFSDGAVYLDLQVTRAPDGPPLRLEMDNAMQCLHFEMRDALGRLIPPNIPFNQTDFDPLTLEITPHNLVTRLPAGSSLRNQAVPEGFSVAVNRGVWVIPPGATNTYFLSATFSPSTNHISSSSSHLWRGVLGLPSVQILTRKP